MKIRIVIKRNVKFNFESRFIIHKQVLNNVILTFECETQI